MMFTSANMPAIGSRVVLHMGADREPSVPMPANGRIGTVTRHGEILDDDVWVCFDVEPDADQECDPAWLAPVVGG
jgi:hypothetical protein